MPDYRNPFIVGGSVSPERFIGREREVEAILDRLAGPAPGSIAVSGEMRIGKTSLLHYIHSSQAAEKWDLSSEKCAFVFVDTRTIVPFTPDSFWRYILKSLVTQQVYDPKRMESLLKDRVEAFELGELFDRIAQDGKRVVLLLDGLEYVIEHVSPDNPDFLNLLRGLINRPMHGLILVPASHRPLVELLQDFRFAGSPFTTSFTSLSLGPFSPEEANRLIDVYTQATDVTFSDRDREFAYEVSKGHPYWLQNACFKLFQRHVEKMGQRRGENE
jgi:AAA+ ATPase superfamily predicted ATPase